MSLSLRRSRAIVANEFRIAFDDPGTVVFLLVIPLLMMAFLRPVFRLALNAQGFAGANGSEHVVPGMAVMFVAFGAGYTGFAFFREHGWGTWERLRASRASSLDIMVGKLIPTLVISALQIVILFALGSALFDLQIRGSVVALIAVSLVLAVCLLGFGMVVTALSRTAQQLNTFGNIGSMLLITLGGSLAPLSAMPEWAKAAAPFTPTYWSMEAYMDIVLEGAGVSDVLAPIGVMLLFSVGFGAVAVWRFRLEESKAYYG